VVGVGPFAGVGPRLCHERSGSGQRCFHRFAGDRVGRAHHATRRRGRAYRHLCRVTGAERHRVQSRGGHRLSSATPWRHLDGHPSRPGRGSSLAVDHRLCGGAGLGLWHPGILDAATAPTGVAGKIATITGSMVALLAATAVPLALIVAGQGLDFRHVREYPRTIGWTVAAKLLAVPLLTWGVCRLLGADALTTTAATILMASPAAIASVPMARLLGGDVALMAALVTATTVIAPLTLLGWLLLVGLGV